MRVVVIGAGIVGAACAHFLARDGHAVTVVDRGPVGGGTTSRGEGNILVSDKGPGPELDLARRSAALWRELGDELGADAIELEAKGGLVVAAENQAYPALVEFAGSQRDAGVRVEPIAPGDLRSLEPHLAEGLAGGVFYPEDQQVQPILATAHLLRAARSRGAQVRPGVEVAGIVRGAGGAIAGIRTTVGGLPADAVVNAAGTWGGRVSELMGGPIPVLPRRGVILVTEPLPRVVRHKVYSADYVANVASSDAGLETSVVIEGTRGGTVLIGASRERVGFDAAIPTDVVRVLAAQAIRLFPFLAGVDLLRSYQGFRPYCPDHLPVIGADPRVPGLWHACGHEGAGIGLAPATGELVADLLAGRSTAVPAEPFAPQRFAAEAA